MKTQLHPMLGLVKSPMAFKCLIWGILNFSCNRERPSKPTFISGGEGPQLPLGSKTCSLRQLGGRSGVQHRPTTTLACQETDLHTQCGGSWGLNKGALLT